MLLGNGLEGEAHGAGADPCIENRQRSSEQIAPGRIFEHDSHNDAKHRTDGHLHEVELDAVDFLHVVVHAGDLDGVEKGA